MANWEQATKEAVNKVASSRLIDARSARQAAEWKAIQEAQYPDPDPVDSPSHYTRGNIEVIDFIQDNLTPEEFAGFCKGNILKYVARAGHKNPDTKTQDLEKAAWYLNRKIASTPQNPASTDTPKTT